MARITCLHGHEIEVQSEQLGERIACPACQLLIFISPPRPGEPIVPKYEVLCDNGHVLRVKSKYLGTQIRCPQCQGLAWVTTDRLQSLHSLTTPVVKPPPVVIAKPLVARPAAASPAAIIPVAATLDDIPVAEVDESFTRKKLAASRLDNEDDDDAEVDSSELTKAERRNMKLADQGLGFFLGSVIGYCTLQMVGIVISFILFLIMQGISTIDGFQTLGTVSDVIGWIIFIALVLNTLLYLAGVILTMFTPWITGATVWFLMGLVMSIGFLGWRIFLIIRANAWKELPAVFALTGSTLVDGKLFYFIGEILFLIMWVMLIVALWQLGKFARKPMTRQRVMLLGMLGIGCWVVIVIYPLLGEWIPQSKAAVWVLLIFRVLLSLGFGGLLIFQHLNVVNDVRAVMARRK